MEPITLTITNELDALSVAFNWVNWGRAEPKD